jgi:hypothetical protein
MVRGGVAVVVAASLFAGEARAQAVPEAETAERRNAVYGVFGFATPVGTAGIEAVRRFGSVVEIAVGLGLGMSAALAKSGSPLQWSVMPRLRVAETKRGAMTLGAGLSGGNIGDIPLWCDEYCDEQRMSYPTHYWMWANFEIGGEHWIRKFALRYFLGYARGCEIASSCSSTLNLPYFGMGFGVAF